MASIFTKIINREIPADIVYEDDVCIAFRDITPQAPIHIVITSKKEIRSLADLEAGDEKILAQMLVAANKIAHSLKVAEDGFRVVINTNKDGGQSVFHIHMHLLAGRALSWPPG
jgi:histidine triad (HIT) family protein